MNAPNLHPIQRGAVLRFALILLLASLACSTLSATPTPPATYPDEINIDQAFDLGPGPFIYADTTAGLSELSAYVSTLKLNFDGTVDGQATTWSRTYSMLAANDPTARQWTIESGDGDKRFAAELNGVDYNKIGDGQCNAIPLTEGDTLADRLELASFLTGVLGADEAGSETVNGIQAGHYTFDQRALAEQDISESTGEMWVASEGGYIVKYVLTTKADEHYFGDGVAGTLHLEYQINTVNAPETFTLPDDCPAGMVDAPLMDDALNVERTPGLLTYETKTSIKDAATFYRKELPKLGWTEQLDISDISDKGALLQFVQGDQTMSITMSPVDGQTDVAISLGQSLN